MGSDDEHEESQFEQPGSWQEFWQRATEKNDEAMRQAGKDPKKYALSEIRSLMSLMVFSILLQ
jgi:hypothetical protein